ncbi:MAG: APC family permease [Bdellovibrionaceae bacterium]|nr:APC family permease [Pseudobdellovibrionaceae bacterium]
MPNKEGKLGFWPQVALIFFIVSGGAYGIEPLVHEVGTKWAILLILLIPLFWVIPIVSMVAELSSALPEAGGYYVWVRRALGRFWGFQEGWWTLCYSAVDLAVYPVLFVAYLSFFFPTLGSDDPNMEMVKWGLCSAFIVLSLLFNLRGIRLVGMNALVTFGLVIMPFVVLSLWGIFTGSWQQLFFALTAGTKPDITFVKGAAGLAIILWNYCGWDNISTYAHEVHHPEKNYPKALLTSMIVIILSYLIPMFAGLKTSIDSDVWNKGWPAIAELMGGPILGLLIAIAALLSAWALFNSQLLYISRIPMAMAKDGLLPKVLSKISPTTGVPVAALILMAMLAISFSRLSFSKLIIVDILFYMMGLSLEFLTLIVLRRKEPNLKRPFKIPLGISGLILMALVPMSLVCGIALFSTLGPEGSFTQIQLVIAGLLLGFFLYFLFLRQERRTPS